MIPERFEPVLEAVRPLADAFADAGHRLYLVGGIVRDLLVGEVDPTDDAPEDWDFTTDARPDEIEAVVRGFTGVEAVWTQGKRFGTIGCRIAVEWDGATRSVAHEITTHRAEAYSPDSRKPDVEFSTDIEADLSRRDFTVNAMALALPGPDGPDARLVDPFDGMADLLVHKALRTPLAPEESFADDPLRMLRAARFLNRFDLTPDPELVLAVEKMTDRLQPEKGIVSAERIRDELCRLVVLDDCAAGLWFLCDTGLAHEFFPELPEMRVEQDPIHRHKDVWAHSLAVIENAMALEDGDQPDVVLRLAALFHDIAKPDTRRILDDGNVTFHHHEVVGARMTKRRMKALRFDNDTIKDVSRLVELHLRFHTYKMGWTDSAVRRYVRDAGHLLDRLNKLTRADVTTRNARKARAIQRRMDDLEVRIAELLEQEELEAMRPPIDGNQIMARTGMAPGRQVGEAWNWLLELRLEAGPVDEDAAYAALDRWWAAVQDDAEPPDPAAVATDLGLST